MNFDFSLQGITKVLKGNIQFAILGSGEHWIVNEFTKLSEQYPKRLRFHSGYSEALAHRIEAGSNFYLMPSLYEPYGLNPMHRLR
jgi:starch synthase